MYDSAKTVARPLKAFIFERLVHKDVCGLVIIIEHDLDGARAIYRREVCERVSALLKEFGRANTGILELAENAIEDLDAVEVREIELVSGAVILNQ